MTITYTAGVAVTPQRPFTVTATFTGLLGGATQIPSGAFAIAAVGVFLGSGEALSTTGTLIGGQSATLLAQAPAGDGTSTIALFGATMPSAENATVSFVDANSVGWSYCAAALCYLTGSATTTTSTGGNDSIASEPITPASSLNLPAGGIGVVANWLINGGLSAEPVPTWSTTGNSGITSSGGDVTANFGVSPWAQLTFSHSITSNAAWLPSLTGGGNYTSGSWMVAATFAPSAPRLVLALPRRIFVRR